MIWNDAIRAHTLRAVVTVPLTVGTHAAVGSLTTLGDAGLTASLPGPLLAAGLVVLILSVGAALVWTATGQPQRHFRTRLWPGHPLLTSGGRSRA